MLKSFGTRSMGMKGIVYPYWENRAKGYEDVILLLFVVEILCLIYPLILLVKKLHWCWKNKKKAGDFLKECLIAFYKWAVPAVKKIPGYIKRVNKLRKGTKNDADAL